VSASTLVAGLGIAVLLLAGCSGAQDKKQAQFAAIGAGCEAELAAVGEAGASGDDAADVKKACEESIHAWRVKP
jgi:hypothetical protein